MSFRLVFKVLVLLIGINTLGYAAEDSRVPSPVINKGKGDKCVEPTDVMRRNHMKYILHQRDETMHKGIRTSKYSLAECIDCHVQPDENGNIASVDTTEHFCSTCHEYAGVTIDCFECHADKPQKFIKRDGKSASLQQELHQMLSANSDTGGVK